MDGELGGYNRRLTIFSAPTHERCWLSGHVLIAAEQTARVAKSAVLMVNSPICLKRDAWDAVTPPLEPSKIGTRLL